MLTSNIQFALSCSLVTLLRVVCFWVASSCENNVIMNSPVKLLVYWQRTSVLSGMKGLLSGKLKKAFVVFYVFMYPHKLFLFVLIQGILKTLLLHCFCLIAFNCFKMFRHSQSRFFSSR